MQRLTEKKNQPEAKVEKKRPTTREITAQNFQHIQSAALSDTLESQEAQEEEIVRQSFDFRIKKSSNPAISKQIIAKQHENKAVVKVPMI